MYDKTVLTVNGAIFGLKQEVGPNGPRFSYLNYAKTMDPATTNPAPNTILMSTDPVTAEFQGIKIMRINENEPYAPETMPDYLRASAGIAKALDPAYNIGVLDEKEMSSWKWNGRE